MSFKEIFIFYVLAIATFTYAMDDQIVTLQSMDKQKFQVKVGVTKLSVTLKNLMEDAGTDVPIFLPNIQGATLGTVLELLHIIKTEENLQETQTKIHTKLSSLRGQDLVDCIAAANFLDIPVLLSNAIEIAKSISIGNLPPSVLNLPKEIRNAILYAQAREQLGIEQINQSLPIPIVPQEKGISNVLMLPDNKRMVVVFKNSVRLFDIQDKKNVKQIALLKGGIHTALCVTPDSSKILVKQWGETKIRILDSHSFKELGAIIVGVEYGLATISTDGSRIIAGIGNDVYVWNYSDGLLLAQIKLDTVFKDLGADVHERRYVFQRVYAKSDGTFIIACSFGVLAWDLATFNVITVFDHEKLAALACLTRDENKIIILFNQPNMITILDLRSKETRSFKTNDFINSLAITPDGNKIVGATETTIHIWDLNGIDVQRLIVPIKQFIAGVRVTPDGMHVVSAGTDATLHIWDIPNYESLFNNISSAQAWQVFDYLQGDHAEGWKKIREIFGVAKQEQSAAEPLAKKYKK